MPTTVIEPSKGFVSLKLRELWEYRELLYFLTWRDIKVRYKQTALGAAWAIIQPFFTMVVFSLFFGRLAKVPSDGIPYPIFSFAALVPWTLFAYGLSQSSNSLVGSANLIQKVYFPRLVIPISSVLSGLVDFLLAFVVLLGMMWFYGMAPTINVIWLPALVLLALVTALGVGLWLSALNVEYRDIRYTVAVYHPVLDVRHPHRLSQQPAAGTLAHPVRPQPHGGGGGRLPLGPPGHQNRARTHYYRLHPGDPGHPGRRRLLFPAHGKDLRRCGLIRPSSEDMR